MDKKQQNTIKNYANYIESYYQEQKAKNKNVQYWKIPVTWEECGIICIPKTEEINSLQKAFLFVSDHLDEIELKNVADKKYVDSSFRLSHEDAEEIEGYQ